MSDKTSDSFMTASTQGVLPFPTQAVAMSFFQSLRAAFSSFSHLATYFQVLFLNMGMICQEEPKMLNDLEKQSL